MDRATDGRGGFRRAAARIAADPAYLLLCFFIILLAVFGGAVEALCCLCASLLVLADRARLSGTAEDYFLSAADRVKTLTPYAQSASSFLGKVSVLSLAISLPLIIRALSGGFPVKDMFSGLLTVAALSTVAVSRSHGALFASVISGRLGRLAKEKSDTGPLVTDPAAAEKLASADCLMILDPSLIYDVTAEVRTVFSGGTVYSGMALGESAMRGASETAIVMTALASSRPGGVLKRSHEDAFDRFCEFQLGANPRIHQGSRFSRPVYDVPAEGDISVRISYAGGQIDSESRFRSCSRRAVSACQFIRLHNGGTSPMTPESLAVALSAFDSMSESGLTPYVLISSPSASEDGDSSLFPNGRILECIVGIGGAFPEDNAQAASALTDFGLTPLLVLPSDSQSAARFARESGLCDPDPGADDFCAASELTSDGGLGSGELEKKRVFRGFSREDCLNLLRRLKREGKNSAAVIKRQSDLPLTSETVCSAGVYGSADAAVSESVGCFVSRASTDGTGGLGSVFSLISESVSLCGCVRALFAFFIAFGAMILTEVLASAVAGELSLCPSAPVLMILSEAILLIAVSSFSEDKVVPPGRESASGNRRNLLFCLAAGLLTAAAAELAGQLAFGEDRPARLAYITPATVFSGISMIFALRTGLRKKRGNTGINPLLIIYSTLAVAVCVGFVFLPLPDTLASFAGRAVSPLICLLVSLIPAAVPFICLLAFVLLTREEGIATGRAD